jgi:DNA-binding response OmpR family regulator
MNILLIEPDHILAANYRTVLEQAGHHITYTPHAQTALTLADEHTPDVVIMEMLLPIHNGVEFLYEFRSYTEWQDIPVIVLTLVPEEAVKGQAVLFEKLGVRVYLYKPHTKLNTLVRAIDLVGV